MKSTLFSFFLILPTWPWALPLHLPLKRAALDVQVHWHRTKKKNLLTPMPESMKNNFLEGGTAPPALSPSFAIRNTPAAVQHLLQPRLAGMERAGAGQAWGPLSPIGNAPRCAAGPLAGLLSETTNKAERTISQPHRRLDTWKWFRQCPWRLWEQDKGLCWLWYVCEKYTPIQSDTSAEQNMWKLMKWRALCVMQSTWMMCVHTKICSALLISSPLGQLDLICHFPAKILLLYLSTWPFFKEIAYDSPVLT